MPSIFHQGPHGKTTVSEAFNTLCTNMKVEVKVTIMPNPGDPFRSMRLLHFRSFTNKTIVVTQLNKKKTETKIPALGECDIMLTPEEEMPTIEIINA